MSILVNGGIKVCDTGTQSYSALKLKEGMSEDMGSWEKVPDSLGGL